MGKFLFVPNNAGIREILKSDKVANMCKEEIEKIHSQVSVAGYEVGERNYPERRGYALYTADYPAIQDNLSNNTLEKIKTW